MNMSAYGKRSLLRNRILKPKLLEAFPLDALKIDRSFLQHLITDPEDAGIIQGIVARAQALKRKTIAGGMETKRNSLS